MRRNSLRSLTPTGAGELKIVGWVQPIKRTVFEDNNYFQEEIVWRIKTIPRVLTEKADRLYPPYAG
jgi:hypothetical protein